ncbi:hypothetical protein [Dictyobacter halimunensis]|uniref:hypothetical protein n=1 Tax=Dictyobacter halimunensis TaxID=3026934 RepID=UPI0030C65A13
MYQRQTAFWAWSVDDWFALLGSNITEFSKRSHRAASPTIGAGAPSHPPAPPEEPSTDEDTLVFSTPVTVEEVTDSLGAWAFTFGIRLPMISLSAGSPAHRY